MGKIYSDNFLFHRRALDETTMLEGVAEMKREIDRELKAGPFEYSVSMLYDEQFGEREWHVKIKCYQDCNSCHRRLRDKAVIVYAIPGNVSDEKVQTFNIKMQGALMIYSDDR